MKRLLTLLMLIVAVALPSWGQAGNTLTIPFAGAPTGSCAFLMQAVDTTAGTHYFCNALTNAWVLSTSGAVTPSGTLTLNHLALGAGTTVVKVDSACTTDAAGALNCPTVSTGTAPTACGSATGCFGATGASTASTKTASQGSLRLDSTSTYWLFRNVNGTSEAIANTAFASTCGASCSLDATNGISQTVQCTQSCTVTLFAPALHAQVLVYMKPGVTGTITLAALGGSGQYGKCDGSAYGTAGTGTFALSSATGNRVGLVAIDTTHYDCVAVQGTATVN